MKQDLSINIGALCLKNPVMVASGTFGYADEFKDFIDLRMLGAMVTKTVTLKPRQGNPAVRTCEAPAGMLNSIGLENPGIDNFLKEKLPLAAKWGVPVIVSISAEEEPGEFITLARRLDGISQVAAIELNISCPNIVSGTRLRSAGRRPQAKLISQDPKATYALVRSVRKATKKTLIAKLSPNVTDITAVAKAAEEAGSDALALVNTFLGMAIDTEGRKPKLASGCGGLSGPGIRPIALRMVWEAFNKIDIPIIGMGGIIDTLSALEFIIAGASAVSVGTANFVNPRISVEVIRGIRAYLERHNMRNFKELVGSLKV